MAKKVSIHLRREGHQGNHARAIIEGLKKHGVRASTRSPQTGDVIICWGWRVGERYRKLGFDVLVLERGYLGDRFKYSSLALNGLNNRGWFPFVGNAEQRFDKHFAHLLKPWQPAGDYVLICGQKPGDMSLRGKDLVPWYAEQADHYSKMGYQVQMRPHPLDSTKPELVCPPSATLCQTDLKTALANAALVITHNSNTGVDALMAGKQATCADEGAMIYPWNGTDQHRIELIKSFAGKQWLLHEFASGEALAGFADFLRCDRNAL